MLAIILKDCIGSTVKLQFTESSIAPVGIQPKDEREFFIIMPLRNIDDEEEKKETEKVKGEEVETKKTA